MKPFLVAGEQEWTIFKPIFEDVKILHPNKELLSREQNERCKMRPFLSKENFGYAWPVGSPGLMDWKLCLPIFEN